MCALTSSASGVSGRAMSSRSTGTSGAYLAASLPVFGPLVWMRPTPLSVKSDILMTGPRGLCQAGGDMLAVLSVTVPARLVFHEVCDGGDQSGGPRAELGGERGDGFGLAPAGG